MKIKLKRTTPDYREAFKLFTDFKAKGTAYITYDYSSKLYIVELWQESKTISDFYRIILSNIETDTPEEQDALAYADSAIKTLVDMGVIE